MISLCPPPDSKAPRFRTWRTGIIPAVFARAFAPPPDMEIWQWADENVWLVSEDAAEPGPYRSAKTPWTRRLQELLRDPFHYVFDFTARKWTRVRVNVVAIQKSSQSGFSEACFNGIRWRASFRPCNVIFAIDTESEAKKVARRLLRSLQFLDPGIFSGDPDAIKTCEFLLRGMELQFYGSFSAGKFANKQAELLVVDEYEEHAVAKGDTTTLNNLISRFKTAKNGLLICLSKPKLEDGPINKEYKAGNCEEFFVPCPHCGHRQPVDFESTEIETAFTDELEEIRDEQTCKLLAVLPRPLDLGQTRKIKTMRVEFAHCKNILQQWDTLRVDRETHFVCCACEKPIAEHQKQWMSDRGLWLPTQHGPPGTVSQRMHDLLSTDEKSSIGKIANEFIAKSKSGAEQLQGWLNHRLGKTRKVEANKTDESDIKANIGGQPGDGFAPYRRGIIPFKPRFILLGADIGLEYARWAVGAVAENLDDIAIFDWGNVPGPESIAELMLTRDWGLVDNSKRYRVSLGFMDAHYRKTDAYRACLAVLKHRRQHALIPTAGIGGPAARKIEFSFGEVPGYPPQFRHLSFRDSEAKNDLYIERIKKKKRRLWFPVDVLEQKPHDDPDWNFADEMCGERYIVEPGEPGHWQDPAPFPNHSGDCVKGITNGLRFYVRLKTGQIKPDASAQVPA